jgi:hypothetical protein
MPKQINPKTSAKMNTLRITTPPLLKDYWLMPFGPRAPRKGNIKAFMLPLLAVGRK